jgi:hypothetical protein
LGVIIGAVVGSLALLALVGLICCVIRRKARDDQATVPEEPIEIPRSNVPTSLYNSVPRSGASEAYSDLTLGPVVSAYASTTQSHSSYSPIPNQAPAPPAIYTTGSLPRFSEL